MAHRTDAVDAALWVAFGVSVGVLVWFSVLAIPPTPSSSAGDELLHALAYAVTFGVLLLAAVWRPGRGDGPLVSKEMLLVASALVLGGVLELVQAAVGRDPSLLDAAADASGVAVAWVAHRTLRRAAAGATP